jgi:hypothetical protein
MPCLSFTIVTPLSSVSSARAHTSPRPSHRSRSSSPMLRPSHLPLLSRNRSLYYQRTQRANRKAFDASQAGPQSPKRKLGSESAASMTPTTTKKQFDRPFYEIIVDGIHSHPNSVRVGFPPPLSLLHRIYFYLSSPIHPILPAAFS